MLLLDTAISMYKNGYSIEEIREELRKTILGNGLEPTCSYVEDVLRELVNR